MNFLFTKRPARAVAPDVKVIAGSAARAAANTAPDTLGTRSAVTQNVTAIPEAATSSNSLEPVFLGSDFKTWWATDYSVGALKRRGEYDLWNVEDAPILPFGGEQWTPYHMPLTDESGNPSPKLLLALEQGSLQRARRNLGISQRRLEDFREQWANDENAAALEYFSASNAAEVFANGIKGAIDRGGRRVQLRGLMLPTHLSIESIKNEKIADDPRTLVFWDCFLFGDLEINNADLELLRFIRCKFNGKQSFENLRVGLLWWLTCTFLEIRSDFRASESSFQESIEIRDSEFAQINSNDFAPYHLRLTNVTAPDGCYFYNVREANFRCFISDSRIGSLFFGSRAENRQCEPRLQGLRTKFNGDIDIDANMNHAEFFFEECDIIGPFHPYGIKLHPRSTFSDVNFKIDPNQYCDSCIEGRQAFYVAFNAAFDRNESLNFDIATEREKYVRNVENSFRHLRKLAKDNKQTDQELEFYARQFEAHTMRDGLHWAERTLMNIYRLTSNYGTSLARPFYFYVLTSIALALVGAAGALSVGAADQIGDAAFWAAGQIRPELPAATDQFRPPDVIRDAVRDRTGILYIAVVVTKIVAFSLIALFVIALRRRFQID